jgi:aerobic C4-dicarboxylate transport protein
MVLLLGVDRFMSEARAITNTIGNAVGTVAIAKWVGGVDSVRMQRILDGHDVAPLTTPVEETPVPVEPNVVGLAGGQKASA